MSMIQIECRPLSSLYEDLKIEYQKPTKSLVQPLIFIHFS